MLVLSRRTGETIRINNDIKVTVVEIRGNKIRLGIDAPREIPVYREEIYELLGQPQEAPQDKAAQETPEELTPP